MFVPLLCRLDRLFDCLSLFRAVLVLVTKDRRVSPVLLARQDLLDLQDLLPSFLSKVTVL